MSYVRCICGHRGDEHSPRCWCGCQQVRAEPDPASVADCVAEQVGGPYAIAESPCWCGSACVVQEDGSITCLDSIYHDPLKESPVAKQDPTAEITTYLGFAEKEIIRLMDQSEEASPQLASLLVQYSMAKSLLLIAQRMPAVEPSWPQAG